MDTQTAATVPIWTVADKLIKARQFAGLSQADMADRLQIGRRSIVRYESSTTPPRTIVLAYASVTGVPLEWFDEVYPGQMFVTATYTPFKLAA